MIDKKIAYEELGLLPIWLQKNESKNNTHALFDISFYKHKELNFSILVKGHDELPNEEKKLLRNIHLYFKSISENSMYYKNIVDKKINEIFNKNLSNFIFSLGADNLPELDGLGINIQSLPSLNDMLVNPEKKRKLWHDIQSLLSSEKKEGN